MNAGQQRHKPDQSASGVNGRAERQLEIYEPDQIRKRNWAYRNQLVREAELSKPLKFVLTVLWGFVGTNASCWPSQTTLADACGYKSVSGLQKILRELRRIGIISVTRRYDGCRQTSSQYIINFQRLESYSISPASAPETIQDSHAQPESLVPTSGDVDVDVPTGGDVHVRTDGDYTSPREGSTVYRKSHLTTTTTEEPQAGKVVDVDECKSERLTGTDADSWDSVERQLFDFKVATAVETTRVAIERGLCAAEVAAIIDVARMLQSVHASTFQLGWLVWRIRNGRPGANPKEGWGPDPAKMIEGLTKLETDRYRSIVSGMSEIELKKLAIELRFDERFLDQLSDHRLDPKILPGLIRGLKAREESASAGGLQS